MKIRFLETYTVQSVDGAKYEQGSVHELPEGAALHFVRRGRAVVLTDNGQGVIAEAKPKPPSPPAEREITTSVDLASAYNRARQKEGIPELVRRAPQTESRPVVVSFGDNPLVSCVMPTFNRRPYIRAAIDCWLKQTYQNKELIILDDGDDPVRDLVPRKKGIRYIRNAKGREITGTKRNHCCELAKGEIICHWDDDDWSAPDRIEHQLGLLRQTGRPITGFGTLYFWDTANRKALRYRAAAAGYVCGTSLMYLKSYWQEHKFPDQQKSSDNAFVYPALKQIASSHDPSHMVARIHDAHTSSKDGIHEAIGTEQINPLFWDNDKLRQS